MAVVASLGGLLGLATPAAAEDAPSDAVIEVVLTDDAVTVDGVELENASGPDGPLVEPRSFSQCLSGNVCVWTGYSYTGTYYGTASASPVNTGIGTAHSVANRSTKAALVYAGASGTGGSVCLDPGDQYSSLSIGALSLRILTVTSC